MKTHKEIFDQSLLDSLEKKYQLFLDSPNGEINVYLVLSKGEEESSKNDPSRTRGTPSLNNFNNNTLKQNKSSNIDSSKCSEKLHNDFSEFK